jgi:DNA (cytosine-5)-methyltransferase 1
MLQAAHWGPPSAHQQRGAVKRFAANGLPAQDVRTTLSCTQRGYPNHRFVTRHSARQGPNRRPGNGLRVAGLFAGIGGIEHGFHRSGHSTSLLCEIDPAASAVLEERFPGVPQHRDVAKLRDVGDVDVITAGFPCQDLSQAGTTQGLEGDKSSLVVHVFRLLDRRPVPWVVLENVPFMLQLARGQALDWIVREFERRQYKWAYRVVDTRAFGLPQRRERVYLVASQVHDPRTVLFSGNESPIPARVRTEGIAYGFYWTEGSRGLGWAVDAVPTIKGGSTIGIPSPPAIWCPSGEIVRPHIRDAERLQGFEAGWTTPAERVAKPGIRWKLVGNAVTVDVAAWVGARLLDRNGYDGIEGEPVRAGRSWPRAAWNVGNGRMTAPFSTWPVAIESQPLVAFLRHPTSPLSERATSGFLARFTASTLAKPDGFVEALKSHVDRVRRSEDAPTIVPRKHPFGDRADPRP